MSVIWPDKSAIFAAAEPLLKGAEGLRLTAYLCPTGHWTIGWGCTQHPDGEPVRDGDFLIDESEAEAYLQTSMGRILHIMQTDGAITRDPTVNEAAALLSLAYNVGMGLHDGHTDDLANSTLIRLFNEGQTAAAALRFLDWCHARVNGEMVVLPGLKTRREAEMKLFLTSNGDG